VGCDSALLDGWKGIHCLHLTPEGEGALILGTLGLVFIDSVKCVSHCVRTLGLVFIDSAVSVTVVEH